MFGSFIVQFTERALAHHLLDPLGGATSRYHVALAMLRVQRQEMALAEAEVQAAVQLEYEVSTIEGDAISNK